MILNFEANTRRTLKPKFDANGVDDAGPLFIDFSTRRLRTRYNDTLQVNSSKELCTTFDCKGLKTGSVLSLDSTTKLLDFKYDSTYFDVGSNNIFKPSFLCSGINTGTPLSLNASKLKLDYGDEFTTGFDKLRINLVAGGGLSIVRNSLDNGIRIDPSYRGADGKDGDKGATGATGPTGPVQPTPTLQEVLTAGNDSDLTILLKDALVAPTSTNTITNNSLTMNNIVAGTTESEVLIDDPTT